MSVKPIAMLGDSRLRLKGEPVDSFGKYLHGLLDDLAHTMRDAPGVGLAAPQLGEAQRVATARARRSISPSIFRPKNSRRRLPWRDLNPNSLICGF